MLEIRTLEAVCEIQDNILSLYIRECARICENERDNARKNELNVCANIRQNIRFCENMQDNAGKCEIMRQYWGEM